MKLSLFMAFAITLLGSFGLGGCGPMLMAGIATSGVVLAQERSVGNAIDDATIQFTLRERLHQSMPGAFGDVDLEIVEGRVLMTGRVDAQETRIEASRLAWTTGGVDDVINEIEINDRELGFIRPRDTWISTQLRARLINDSGVRQVNYHIETMRGTIYLFGVAQDEAELGRATEHARTIRGVDRVVSHMRVKYDRLAPPARGV